MKTSHVDIPFPYRGMHEDVRFGSQPQYTCVDVQNMRAHSPVSGRSRGAQRSGLSKYLTGQFSANAIQDINCVTSVSAANVRAVTQLAVCNGDVKTFSAAGSFGSITGGTGALDSSATQILSVECNGDLFYADGTNSVYYDSSAAEVKTWTLTTTTGGAHPVQGSDKARIIERFQGRVVLSGIDSDKHMVYMSAMGDPFNFEYDPNDQGNTQAWAGNVAEFGAIGEKVNGIIPVRDQQCFIGTDRSIWVMNGNPHGDGQVYRLTGETGIAFGRAWCVDRQGVIYFYGSRGGVFRLVPNEGPPKSMTDERIHRRLADVDISGSNVRLAWNDDELTLHVAITPVDNSATTHYAWDSRNDAWFKDVHATADHNPFCLHVYDGDGVADRVLLYGCQDGYIRQWDSSAADDDGTAIDAYVVMGPVIANNLPFVVRDVSGQMATGSADVSQAVHVGNTAELAKALTGYDPGVFPADRSVSLQPMKRGYAAYFRLGNSTVAERWEFERLSATLGVAEKSRRRVFA